jgi:hypothetical protein
MEIVSRIVVCALLLATQLATDSLLAKGVSDQDLRRHVAILASDAFEGRAPGTNGETLTIRYITDVWGKAGLKSAARDGTWYDPVALLQRRPTSAKYEFAFKGRKLKFVGDDIMLIGNQPIITQKEAPVWFAGYGVDARGQVSANVAGKVVIILSGDAEHVSAELRSARVRRDAILDAGALAVIIVAEGPGDWSVMRRQILSRPIARDENARQSRLEGSMSSEFAVAMITAAGLDWDKLRIGAKAKDYSGENLPITVNLEVKTELRKFASYNIVGKIAGRRPGSGSVLFLGHWDHLGYCQPPEALDRICNGAIDNASGIAMLTEIARALAKSKPDRDIYFLATTAEESGLLGAYAFAENPPFPIEGIVAAFNLDTVAIAPAGAPVSIVGRGMTALDPVIDSIVKRAKRKVEPSLHVNAFVQRQDGWALSQKGIPAVMVGGAFSDNDRLQKFLGSDYHGPKDELSPGLDLSGAAEDAQLHIALGRYFADLRKFKGIKSGR